MYDIKDDNSSSESIVEAIDVTELIIRAFSKDPVAIAKIVAIISSESYTFFHKLPYMQLKYYIDGVLKAEEDLGNGVKLSDKLFSNDANGKANAMRVFKMVTSTDTEKKLDYVVNATRAMLLGAIPVEVMFRIFRAVNDNLQEDLEFLSSIIEKPGPFQEDFRVQSLVRTGLMVSAGLDLNAYIEEQKYYVSSLGRIVDRFAISMDDEKRENWYREKWSN